MHTLTHSHTHTHSSQELPELWALHLLLPAIGKRLAFSASIELVPLMEIPGVKQVNGITSLHDLLPWRQTLLVDLVPS